MRKDILRRRTGNKQRHRDRILDNSNQFGLRILTYNRILEWIWKIRLNDIEHSPKDFIIHMPGKKWQLKYVWAEYEYQSDSSI